MMLVMEAVAPPLALVRVRVAMVALLGAMVIVPLETLWGIRWVC